MSSKLGSLHYRLDGADRIVETGSGWDEFAHANDGAGSGAADILHRKIYDFITDKPVQLITQSLLEHARKRAVPFSVPFRCDGPSCMREMKMTLAADANGEVDIQTEVVRKIPRMLARLLDRRARRSNDLIHICAWCKCILHEGSWIEIDVAVSKLGYFTEELLPQLSHGICPACDAAVSAQMEQLS